MTHDELAQQVAPHILPAILESSFAKTAHGTKMEAIDWGSWANVVVSALPGIISSLNLTGEPGVVAQTVVSLLSVLVQSGVFPAPKPAPAA